MLKEDREAAAARKLAVRGKRIKGLKDELKKEMALAKPEIIEAKTVGVPTRRIQELTSIALATIDNWTKTDNPQRG
jgi:hypothetical protein